MDYRYVTLSTILGPSGSIISGRKAPVRRVQEMTPIKQRAAFVSESGLTLGLVDVPKPGPGQILVKVVAAAQNPTDCQFRFAALPLSPEMLQNSLTSALRIYYLIVSREESWKSAQGGQLRRNRG